MKKFLLIALLTISFISLYGSDNSKIILDNNYDNFKYQFLNLKLNTYNISRHSFKLTTEDYFIIAINGTMVSLAYITSKNSDLKKDNINYLPFIIGDVVITGMLLLNKYGRK